MAYSETLVFEDMPAPLDGIAATAIGFVPLPPAVTIARNYVAGTADTYAVLEAHQEFVVDAGRERFTVKEN